MSSPTLADRLFATFLEELDEQLRVLNTELLALEREPWNDETLRAVFRVVHTLKGAARAVNLPAIERACHSLETLLAAARAGDLRLGQPEFGLLFRAADALVDAGERLRSGRALDDSPIAALATALEEEKVATGGVPASLAAATAPSREEPDGGAPPPTPAAPGTGTEPTVARAETTTRVRSDKLDALLASVGSLGIATGRMAGRAGELEAAESAMAHALASWRRSARLVRRRLVPSRDDTLLQAVAAAEVELQKLARQLSRLSADTARDSAALQQDARGVAEHTRLLRLRPFSDACEALPRVARDVADAMGKQVRLELSGTEVEADRAVLDTIREPLVHLVRNAVDHGIETPARRAQAGKPAQGTVRVAAAMRADRLVVTVADDGAGLDRQSVVESLSRRGLDAGPSDRDLATMLLSGGVSTRAEASEFSGRGVGLDIVRSAVARLGGRVDVTWEEGRGTTVLLELPVSLARMRAITAEVSGQMFAFGTVHCERLVRVPLSARRQVGGREVISLPDSESHAVVPLVSLARLLGPPLVEKPLADPATIIVLAVGGARCGLVVDQLCDEQELMVRGLPGTAAAVRYLDGAAMLPDGRIALLADAAAIVASVAEGEGAVTAARVERAQAARRPTVLVVDDSLTTRTLERSVLEGAGYAVLTAVDGADGWRVLQDEPVDLVVADVEMPRMDGLALCEAIRSSPKFKRLPVVLVTALESVEHRKRGLTAGADAYLGKASFDHRNLLEVVAQLLDAVPR